MTADPSPPELNLATTLDRVALAILDVGAMIADVETCILDDIVPEGGTKAVPATVQQLDHALQIIGELSQLVQRLAEAQRVDDGSSFHDTVFPINLERLRHLIAFGITHEPDQQRQAVSEMISLF